MRRLRLGLGLHLLIEIQLCRMHIFGQLLSLPGEFVELRDRVFGRIGKRRRRPDTGEDGDARDHGGKPSLSIGFGEGGAVKLQDLASF